MTVQSQPHTRRHSTCHRHPTTPVTGFCASCLRERLAGIEAAAAAAAATINNKSPSHSGSELRRSKSCSGGPKSDGFPANPCGGDESRRRKSCDVRPRGSNCSLWSLFNLDDERKGTPRKFEVELEKKLGFDLKEEEEIRVEAETKTMKELIDLEWAKKRSSGTGRDLREIAGTFWEKASGLMSKKLTKWRRKTKAKKEEYEDENECVSRRETQSEVGEYGLGGGRRSCDTDPRRFSFDEPRASWDGYLIGKAAAAARMTPMVAVVEDGGSSGEGGAERSSPGGTEQTNDYYSEPRGWRRSFEGVPNPEDLRVLSSSNAKVSPATTELFYGPKLLITERDLKLKPSAAVGGREGVVVEPAGADDHKKAPHGWGRLWKLGERKSDRGPPVGPVGGSVSEKLIRSYSVSCGNQGRVVANGKSREEYFLQRNRSVRYSPSPSNADNGLLRFYLTPLRSYNRRGGQSGKTRLKSSKNSVTTIMPKNVL